MFNQTGEAFVLKTYNEVETFERYLNEYVKKTTNISLPSVSLVNAFEQLEKHENGGRIFAALVDLKLSFVLVYYDLSLMGIVWNTFFEGKEKQGSVLDSEFSFFEKMEVYRHSTSYVLKYRALWDKIMGFLILFFCSNQEYETFTGARSRKKKFRETASNIKQISPDLIQQIEVFITLFDESFRTSEAHGTGVLRKYIFLMDSVVVNPQLELTGFWHFASAVISQIGSLFEYTNNLLPFTPVKLIGGVLNYINLINKNRIQQYSEDLRCKGILMSCIIANTTLLTLEYLRKRTTIDDKVNQEPMHLPTLAENLAFLLNHNYPQLVGSFFNEKFWFLSSKFILNYIKAWELDKEIFCCSPPLIVSPTGYINPSELEGDEKVENYAFALVAAIATQDLSLKLDLANSSAEKLQELLFFRRTGAILATIKYD